MLNDYYDWILLGYHTSLVVLAVVGIRLFVLVLRHVPSHHYRKRLAQQQYDSTAAASTIIEGVALPNMPTSAPEEGISADFVRCCEDKLRLALGRSISAAASLRILRSGLRILISAGMTCAAIQGLSRLSVETHPAPWAYHLALRSVLVQVVWGLPFLVVVYLLEAYCTTMLDDYLYHLNRLCLQVVNVKGNNK